MRNVLSTGATLIACLHLNACSSPDPKLYTLLPTDPAALRSAASVPATIELRRVTIPSYLDRPEMVRSGPDYRVRVALSARSQPAA